MELTETYIVLTSTSFVHLDGGRSSSQCGRLVGN